MAKRNSSSEGGRRGSSRPTSGKSFSGKGRSSDKPYKKSDSSSSKSSYRKSDDSSDSRRKPFSSAPRGGSSDRPYKKFDKPLGEESSSRGEGRAGRPFKKFDKPFDRSSSRGEGPSEKRGSKSFGSSSRGEKPYKKFDKTSVEGSSRREGGSSERPYKKFDKPFDKSSNRDDNSAEKRAPRSFGSSSRGEKPYKKFDKPSGESSSRREGGSSDRPYKKPFDRSSDRDEKSSERRAPRSFGSSNGGGDRPYKKFDKPFDKSAGRSEDSSERPRRSSSSEKPYKKLDKPREESSDDAKAPRERSTSPGLPYKRAYEKGPADGESPTGEQSDFKSRSGRNKREKPNVVRNEDSDIIRLNKYIANSGMSSRREADEFIKMGLVSVNGTVITELGYKVNRGDEVRYEGKVLKSEKPVYILMNKPKGYITTTKDPQDRNTVMHILAGAVKERVYPVGRLDRNTTGLLLLTNDGDLAEKLMHPSYKAKKIYKVDLDRPLTKADFQKIMDGVYLEEGRAVVDDLAIISTDSKTLGIEIHIGWNRVVRRIFEALGYTVEKLDRSAYAGLDKKELARGHWRYLKPEEVVLLKHMKK